MSDVQIFIGLVYLVSGILLALFSGRLGSGLCEKARLHQDSWLIRLAPCFLRESLGDVRKAARIVLGVGFLLAVQGVVVLFIPVA